MICVFILSVTVLKGFEYFYVRRRSVYGGLGKIEDSEENSRAQVDLSYMVAASNSPKGNHRVYWGEFSGNGPREKQYLG